MMMNRRSIPNHLLKYFRPQTIYKPKDDAGIPHRLHTALQAAGWWVRSDIIWHKPNCMPSSVKDRPTTDFEHVFLLAKSKKYFYDYVAIMEPHTMQPQRRLKQRNSERDKAMPSHKKYYYQLSDDLCQQGNPLGRNKRCVWTVNTRPYKGVHFATFPPDLVRPMILAGSALKSCLGCGTPWERVVQRKRLTRPELPKDDPRYRPNTYNSPYGDINGKADAGYTAVRNVGFRPACKCYDHLYRNFQRCKNKRKVEQQDLRNSWWSRVRKCPGLDSWDTVPSIVCDPFAGSGTVCAEAFLHGRSYLGIEANPEYVKMSERRLKAATLGESVPQRRPLKDRDQLQLFP